MIFRLRRRSAQLALLLCISHLAARSRADAGSCLPEGTTFATTGAADNDAPFSVVGCDLDGDGDTDLITANDATDTVSVLVNDGTGGFGPPRQWPVNAADGTFEPVDADCCDFNGDRVPDLVVVNHSADNVSILFGTGTLGGVPRFSAPTTHPVGEAPWSVRCAAIDGDDHPDIVTANFTSDNVSVLINDTEGGVAVDSSYSVNVGGGPRALALCDMDGDTDLDLVTANMSGRSVTVVRNDAGALVDTGDLGLTVNPFAVACCQLDGLGGADIVTANILDDSIVVLLDDGAGTFGSPQRFGGVDGPADVACADVDRDGDVDVATANLNGGSAAVFANLGGGVFDTPDAHVIGDNPSAVAVGSFAGTTGPDVAVALADGVYVLYNTCAGPIDLDGDGDIDLRDFGRFQDCFGDAEATGVCEVADFDLTGTVDLNDHAILPERMTGPGDP